MELELAILPVAPTCQLGTYSTRKIEGIVANEKEQPTFRRREAGLFCNRQNDAIIRCCAPKEGITMRIVVNLNRCLGYAQCVPLAPKTLKLSGEEALEYDPNPDDAQRQQVLRAAASCPVQAILVEELDAKKEVQREHSEKRKRL